MKKADASGWCFLISPAWQIFLFQRYGRLKNTQKWRKTVLFYYFSFPVLRHICQASGLFKFCHSPKLSNIMQLIKQPTFNGIFACFRLSVISSIMLNSRTGSNLMFLGFTHSYCLPISLRSVKGRATGVWYYFFINNKIDLIFVLFYDFQRT